VERRILFIHAGRERKIPVDSLFPGQDLHIWAEFGDFCIEFEKFPVNLPVLVIKMEMQGEIDLFSFNQVSRGTHQPWKRSSGRRRAIHACCSYDHRSVATESAPTSKCVVKFPTRASICCGEARYL
jgi:hypothetical protein